MLNTRSFFRPLTALFWVLLVLVSCQDEGGTEPQEGNEPYTFDIPSYFSRNTHPIPADNPATTKGVELGRMLFYDTRLSGNNNQSCASCHQQEKAFTDGQRFSRGSTGALGHRNSMSLANMLWVHRLFWDGRSATLEEQALIPITDPIEMNQDLDELVAELSAIPTYRTLFAQAFGTEGITPERIANALAQFQRTLISANSKYDQFLRGTYQPTSLELQGMRLFFQHPYPDLGLRGANCGDCHVGPLVAGATNNWAGFHNNGLDTDERLAEGLQAVTGNPADRGKFRAPSLRNIALTAPYMHDGRFQTLEQVLDHYDQHIRMSQTLDPLIIEASNEFLFPGDPIKLYLTPQEKQAVLAFLHMLTDETFIRDPRFSNPFQNQR